MHERRIPTVRLLSSSCFSLRPIKVLRQGVCVKHGPRSIVKAVMLVVDRFANDRLKHDVIIKYILLSTG